MTIYTCYSDYLFVFKWIILNRPNPDEGYELVFPKNPTDNAARWFYLHFFSFFSSFIFFLKKKKKRKGFSM